MAQEKTKIVPDRKLVIDANILLRAVLGRQARSLIERYGEEIPFFIPRACVDEVHEYLPGLCAKRNWELARSLNVLEALLASVKVVEEGFYVDFKEQAMERIGRRDADDWHLVALALSLEAAVWTEDTDFFGSGLATWTMDTVELYLRNDSWLVNDAPAATPTVEDNVYRLKTSIASYLR